MKAELDHMQAEIERLAAAVVDDDDADYQALLNQVYDLEDKILEETVAISPAGLICQIEALRDCGSDHGSDGFDLLIAGARNIEASMSSPSLSNGPIDSAPVDEQQ